MCSRKLARDLGISRTSVQRILKNDLKLHAYKIQNEAMLTDEHKEKKSSLLIGYEQTSEKKIR